MSIYSVFLSLSLSPVCVFIYTFRCLFLSPFVFALSLTLSLFISQYCRYRMDGQRGPVNLDVLT